MRDAFGGLFMIRLLLVFIFIYVIFAAISYNYAQAFRLKNAIISYIEKKDILDLEEMINSGDNSLEDLDEILSKYTYKVTCNGENGVLDAEDDLDPDVYCYKGIVFEVDERDNALIYKVNTFVYMNLPLIKQFYMFAANKNSRHVRDGSIQISGEAKVVKRTEPQEQATSEDDTLEETTT